MSNLFLKKNLEIIDRNNNKNKTKREEEKKYQQNSIPNYKLNLESPIPVFSVQNDRSSRGSATLEDVLASLLGLSTEYRSSGMNL